MCFQLLTFFFSEDMEYLKKVHLLCNTSRIITNDKISNNKLCLFYLEAHAKSYCAYDETASKEPSGLRTNKLLISKMTFYVSRLRGRLAN